MPSFVSGRARMSGKAPLRTKFLKLKFWKMSKLVLGIRVGVGNQVWEVIPWPIRDELAVCALANDLKFLK